ncbi:MAG: phosphoglycerate dehydrogenase [Alphaproteobacteria bacterium]
MIIKATSTSFSVHPVLQAEFKALFPAAQVNGEQKKYSKAELIDFVKDADGIIAGLDSFDDEVLAACPNLKIISKYGVGLDGIDLQACERRGIAIGWTGGVNKRSVAEMDLAFMIGLARNLYPTSIKMKGGQWVKNGGFQLTGKTVGIIGLGFTGTEIIKLLQPFGCEILGNDIIDKSDVCEELGIRHVEKDELFARSDFVALHTPLTDLTHHIMNADTLAAMKPTAFLINAARGPLVKEADLKHALMNDIIAGAALDVYEDEPPADLEFLGLANLYCTPHIGGNADEAVLAMGRSAIHHLKEYFLNAAG